jgi:hypothetical protein
LTISGPSGHQIGHYLHKFGVHWPEGIHKDTSGHRFCARSCSMVIQQIRVSGRLGAMASRGHAAGESSEGRRNLARGSFVVFVGYGIIRSTCFQPCKGGDMACIRGPLGAHLLFIPGKNLGLLTEGETARTTRAEAWTSYRGQSCENKQGRDWDISQRLYLRRIPGHVVNPNGSPDGRYLALPEVRQGKFHFPMCPTA